MGKPMTPRPMNATFADIFPSSLSRSREGGSRWSIYRVRGLAALEHGGEVRLGRHAHPQARRTRGAADVGREDDVAQPEAAGIHRGLALEDVDPGTRDASGAQRLDQRRIV